MGSPSVSGSDDGVNRRLCADDLQWTIDERPRLETLPINGFDLVGLSVAELIDYVIDLREDAAALRLTLHVSLGTVADLTTDLTRARQTIARLHDALREERRAA